MFKNVAAKFTVFAFDATTNVPKTGDAANLTAYVSKDDGTVTVLADTSATEMDATNAAGYYLFDAAQGETNGDKLLVSGKSSTANIKVIGAPAVIYTRPTTGWLAPTTAARTLTVDTSGRALSDVDTIKTNPVVNAGTITFPTTATLASTTNITAGTITTVTNLTNAATAGDFTATMKTSAQTAADAAVTANTLVNAIAGYIDTEVAAIKTQTDKLTFTVANQLDANVLSLNGDATSAANIAKTTRAIGRGTVNGVPTTTSIPTSAFTPTGVDADQFKGRIITFDATTTTTNLRGQSTDITANTAAAAPTFTVTALTIAPAVGDTFSVT